MKISRSRVWVAPNRNAIGLAAAIAAVAYAGASQGNGAAYLLSFTLFAMGCISSVHTWANLRSFELEVGPIPPSYASEDAFVPVLATAHPKAHPVAINARIAGSVKSSRLTHLNRDRTSRTELVMPGRPRGVYRTVKVQLRSIFPLGFFTGRKSVVLLRDHYVYPMPEGDLPIPTTWESSRETRAGALLPGDDFSGVRPWQIGESMRHVDWKAAARGQPLMSKQWVGATGDFFVLDWTALEGLATEARLSQLAQWLIQAERSESAYALWLPEKRFPTARGEDHLHACLRALAAHPHEDSPKNAPNLSKPPL